MRLSLLVFLLLIANPVVADKKPFEPICNKAAAILTTAKHVSDSRSTGRFKDTYDALYFSGCILTVAGIISSEPDYYKILMSLYPNPNNELGRKGWKADRQSDGPDGVSFTIVKKKLFCQVSGDWPGEFFKYRVECGVRE